MGVASVQSNHAQWLRRSGDREGDHHLRDRHLRTERAPGQAPRPDGAHSPSPDYDTWLNPKNPGGLDLLRPCAGEWLQLVPVNTRVNNTRNDDAARIEPLRGLPCRHCPAYLTSGALVIYLMGS
jgi:hypothetical protein